MIQLAQFFNVMLARPLIGLTGLLVFAAPGVAVAQGLPLNSEAVTWSAVQAPAEVARGAKVVLTLKGAVQPGWHVYGLKQAATGPNALRVVVDQNEVAAAAGAATGSAPIKQLDRAFGVETQYYDKDFTLTVPVKVGAKAGAGRQQIPVSVRFQTCNGDICQPPKTVRVNVPVTLKAG